MSHVCREKIPALSVEEVRAALGGRPRVVCAMSGGVDSSTAAALLVEQGYDVVGAMLRLWNEDGYGHSRCCTPEAVDHARHLAHRLGIPFYLVNFEEPFRRLVVDRFVADYARGVTPNPCFHCNRDLRFGLLLDLAQALEADYLATGHYARVRREDGHYRLLQGVDPAKDQSYVLHVLSQEQLRHALFPVGDYRKDEVRALAVDMGLPMAGAPDSQELCFVPTGDYRDFLRDYAAHTLRPGPILDQAGETVGEHRGLPYYTVGQRKGLGLATGEPLYVLALDPQRNAVIVGPEDGLYREELVLDEPHFITGEPVAAPTPVEVKIRRQAPLVPAVLHPANGRPWRLTFEQPQRAPAPGQGAVFYQGEEVLGGATISEGRAIRRS